MNNELLTIPAVVDNKNISCIMDSGSKRNIVSVRFATDINCTISAATTMLRVVNGALVKPAGKVVVNISIGVEIYKVNALVVENFPY